MGRNHLLIILAIAMSVFGCNPSSPTKLRIGYVPIAAGLPLFVAVEKGYFKEEGFETEMVRFTSSNEVGNAGTSGQIDLLLAASNVIFDIGNVSNKRHKLVITNPYSDKPGFITDVLLVRDTNAIKEIEDLKGKNIGIFPGSVIKIFCTLVFKQHGLLPKDYQLIELQPKDWPAAMQSGQIDAVSALEPTASQMIQDGIGVSIFNGLYSKIMPNVPLSGHWISADFHQKYGAEVCDKIVRAYDKAVDFIHENPKEAKKQLITYSNVRENTLDMVNLNPWPKNGELNYDQIQSFIDTLYREGALLNREKIDEYLIHPR